MSGALWIDVFSELDNAAVRCVEDASRPELQCHSSWQSDLPNTWARQLNAGAGVNMESLSSVVPAYISKEHMPDHCMPTGMCTTLSRPRPKSR